MIKQNLDKIKMYVYGEDALTLWALINKIDVVLKEYNDAMRPSECLVFYRPSFGRKTAYGEFDAIVASSKNLYLIESKRDASKLKLDEPQIRRHKVFLFLLKKWFDYKHKNTEFNWNVFKREIQPEFSNEFRTLTIPNSKDVLAQNLQFILKKLYEYAQNHKCSWDDCKNVLLFFYKNKKEENQASKTNNPNFKTIKIDYSQALLNNFLLLPFVACSELDL